MSKPIAEAKFYAMTAEAAVKTLQSDAGRGLSGSEAKKRLSVYGENRLQKGKKTSFAKKFMLQFGDFMVLILLIASAVSFAVSCMQGEANLADPLLILGIVIANAFVGTVQEAKAERALEALRTLSAPHADVLRDGKRAVISAEALVPGDVVYIRAGDVVPADLRLLESVHLQAEESALTGESVPSGKSANAVCDETCGAAERKNMLFSGTGISAGQGVGIVTATGMQTEMGRIAAMLGDEETPDTPLKLRLRRTGKLIGLLVLGICAVIFLIGLIQKAEPLEMFMISISLAVAAIPEGLPAVVTIVLALGVRRMAAKRAIIRHLPAVETLGSCEVICSDKTGTLTQNKMTVVRCAGAAGELNRQDRDALLSAAALCTSVEGSGEKLLGDPTETAIVAAVSGWERLQKQRVKAAEVPFTAERRRMTVVLRTEGGYRVITKGAPEAILPRCTYVLLNGKNVTLTPEMRAALSAKNRDMANDALRVLAAAEKRTEACPETDDAAENGLCFLGLIGLEDPPRPEAAEAVSECKRAGIRPVMITGDQPATASAIAGRLGIENKAVMTGAEAGKPFGRRAFADGADVFRVRAGLSGAQNAHYQGVSQAEARHGHDGRRCERRACPESGGHRLRDGQKRHGGREKRRRHGIDGRQLCDDCFRRAGGADGVRQHPQDHPFFDVVQHRRDLGGACVVFAAHADAAFAGAIIMGEPCDGLFACAGTGQ